MLPQRKIVPKHPRKLAKKTKVTGSNQLWQMDLKYGYIAGIDRFFFIISIIDVYDRCIVAYHIGLRALAEDARRVLKEAILARGVTDEDGLFYALTTAHSSLRMCSRTSVRSYLLSIRASRSTLLT